MPLPARGSERHLACGVWLCGGGCEFDVVAECFELADVAADLAVGADGGDVVVVAEVVVAGGPVGEQVPDDDQDGAGDGHEGFEFAAAAGQPTVALAEEGGGFAGGRGGVAEDAFEVGVALAVASGMRAGAGLDGAG